MDQLQVGNNLYLSMHVVTFERFDVRCHALVSTLSPPRQVSWAILPAWRRRANLTRLRGSFPQGEVAPEIDSIFWILELEGHP